MHRGVDTSVPSGALEAERKVAQRRVYLLTFVVFVVVAGGSFACVFFGIFEIVGHDSMLMNDGLGEVMTVLGICFTVPCVFCVAVFAALTLDFSCLPSIPFFSKYVVMGLILISFVVQQVLCDVYLFGVLGFLVTAVAVLDVFVFGLYFFFRLRSFYISNVLTVVLFVGKTTVLWGMTYIPHAEGGEAEGQQQQIGSNGLFAMLVLTVSIVQLPLYIMETNESSGLQDGIITENSIVENFNNNFNLLLLHLLNSLDIFTVYGSIISFNNRGGALRTIPEPFRILIFIIASVAFVGNNVGVIHLFYARDGVEHAELICLPKKLRDATNQWNSTDVGGSHKRRILQYLLFLVVVCDAPFLAVRTQLWLRGHQMLSVFLIKNVKSILDTVMVVLRVGRSPGATDRLRRPIFES
ncbi:hypothetical protein Tc00.1047053503647.40 [Trypanosoma cruzi]|uniref:Uncharacterized protein n=1 Tax=Trypanosoma cruzi (strain CL Brener) TaxID=353153 RepID=Q4CQ98_TRYCC|nr:hypothetical protein Tc00.1047053503647.40 [Trypanosoma cruzi]EAN82451.1 hypothetical protein Tc00.1047053503647.40 [Trypanosoma cruzi]|eukprot:XP_804302.1 hypothetical protein [Trypanosoma cruzi strain CL Brener]